LSPFVCNHDGSCDEKRLCCIETEMTLTNEDVERIEALGYRREEFVVRASDGFLELRNIDGHCVFYEPSTRVCLVYENRPEGCRYYPVVYDARQHRCVVDEDCPSRATMTREEIRTICPEVRRLITRLIQEAMDPERSSGPTRPQ